MTKNNNIENITFDHRAGDPYNNYEYDNLDRLTKADYLVGLLTEDEVFTMDDLGNRSNVNLRSGSNQVYNVDDLTNRYASIDSSSCSYDPAGNLITDKDGYTHEYDCENRIIRITDANDVEIATFDYDALNRRIRTVDSKAGDTTLYYYSDNWQVLQEYNDANSVQRSFVYGNYIDEVLYMTTSTGAYYCLHDLLHSPAALLTTSGGIAERYEYNAYGKAKIMDPFYNTRTSTTCDNPYYFTGRRLDTLDGGKYEKMQYRFRDYTPFSGRFMQIDPHGIDPAGGKHNNYDVITQFNDGLNSYEYVKSQSIILSDPLGLLVVIPPDVLDDIEEMIRKEKFMKWYNDEKAKGDWWTVLPKCPLILCKLKGKYKNPNPDKWEDPKKPSGAERRLHPGTDISMRSKEVDGHSNQCTYRRVRFIVEVASLLDNYPSAGTVDWKSPSAGWFHWPHYRADVYPIQLAEKLDYGSSTSIWGGRDISQPPGYYMRKYYEVRPSW